MRRWIKITQIAGVFGQNSRFKSSKLIYQRWFLWILAVVSGVRIWQHPTFVPISSSLNLWLTLTRTNQIKLKSEHSGRSLAAHGWMQKNCDIFFLQLRKITSYSFDGCTGADKILQKEFHAAFQSRASGCKAVFRFFLVFWIFTHDWPESQSFLAHHSCRKISSLQQHFTDGI